MVGLISCAVLTFMDTYKQTSNIIDQTILEISRHGWFSTKDEFMVRCASCQENLNLTVPAPSSGIRWDGIQLLKKGFPQRL